MDTVARLEGEEFGLIVLTTDSDMRGADAVARRVREAFRVPLAAEGALATVTVSIGIAVAQVDASDADALMQCAQRALHDVKETSGDAARFFSSELNDRVRQMLALENALRGALERDECVLHYQPKIRIDTGEWSGAEALIRWNRPNHGMVTPVEFISALESTGLIVPVGGWVIAAACRQIAAWTAEGLGEIHVAVNVSGRQFLRHGFVASVAQCISDNGISPESLGIEITERTGRLSPSPSSSWRAVSR